MAKIPARLSFLHAWRTRLRHAERASEPVVHGALTHRMLVASALLALLVCAAFAVLLVAIHNESDSAKLARHSQLVLATANQLERLVVDMETGERGYLLTGEQRFLAPWEDARAAFPATAQRL